MVDITQGLNYYCATMISGDLFQAIHTKARMQPDPPSSSPEIRAGRARSLPPAEAGCPNRGVLNSVARPPSSSSATSGGRARSPQLSLSGLERRDQGIASVAANFDWWIQKAIYAAVAIAEEEGTVDSDRLQERCPRPPEVHPNALGAVFRTGPFVPVVGRGGWKRSTRPEARGRMIRLWRLRHDY